MKTIKLILFVLVVAMFYGCGSKDNKTSSSASRSGRIYDGLGGTESAEIKSIISKYPCNQMYSSSPQRISDAAFSLNYGQSGQYVPGGALQQGHNASGSVTGVYVGKSDYNDIIVIKTMSGGGYNVTLSYCTFEYYISPGSTVSHFSFDSSGATLRTNTGCSVGSVVANITRANITNTQYGGYGEQVLTTFKPVYCGDSSYNNYPYPYYPY